MSKQTHLLLFEKFVMSGALTFQTLMEAFRTLTTGSSVGMKFLKCVNFCWFGLVHSEPLRNRAVVYFGRIWLNELWLGRKRAWERRYPFLLAAHFYRHRVSFFHPDFFYLKAFFFFFWGTCELTSMLLLSLVSRDGAFAFSPSIKRIRVHCGDLHFHSNRSLFVWSATEAEWTLHLPKQSGLFQKANCCSI